MNTLEGHWELNELLFYCCDKRQCPKAIWEEKNFFHPILPDNSPRQKKVVEGTEVFVLTENH